MKGQYSWQQLIIVLIICLTLMNIVYVSGHPHKNRRQRSHHNHHHHYQKEVSSEPEPAAHEETILSRRRLSSSDINNSYNDRNNENKFSTNNNNNKGHRNKHIIDEDYDDEDGDDDGRHAYIMRASIDNNDSSLSSNKNNDRDAEDQTLTEAFEKHMRPSNKSFKKSHDVYAYQLPSDLWFIVRYAKTPEGQVEKYMNIVDSLSNYLDKLDHGIKTVSVNVKGVETVFRLTSKPKK